jgi:uncharacterized protein YifN (PemK superfamily)
VFCYLYTTLHWKLSDYFHGVANDVVKYNSFYDQVTSCVAVDVISVLKLKHLYALKLVVVPVATFVTCLKPITCFSTLLIPFSLVVPFS